jgi:hypothetical protein
MCDVHRHNLVAELIIRGVQTDCKLGGHIALAETAYLWHKAHSGHSDFVLAEVQPEWMCCNLDSLHHLVIIVERLSCTWKGFSLACHAQ